MSKKDEALKLALEALENSIDLVSNEAREAEKLYGKYPARLARIQGLVALEVAHEKAITALREALAEQPAQQESVNKYCCHLCFNKSGQVFLDRMILCPECGNKRCPKATHHSLACTKSNDLGQKGSIYDQPLQQEPVALEDVYLTIIQWDVGGGKRSRRELARRIVAKYTPPPQRKPLTDEEIEDIWADCPADWDDKINVLTLSRAIEAAHGIKENT